MVRITEELVRKKAEHHDDILGELEEISLHQLEIEKIEVIGTICRKLRILYLQNNIIPKIENLYHCKDLRYVNLALNNITVIEGLGSCEFLNKLDLTVNFVDLDGFEASVEHLMPLLHMRELYLMGNPCAEWRGYRAYLAACLPQLQLLDGKEVSRAERITAMQQYKELRAELRSLAAARREEKGLPRVDPPPGDDEDGTEPWTPETRVKMYREMAEQKEEQEKRRRHMEPPKRDAEKEQVEAVERVRAREAEGAIRQTNEGRWEFSVDDEDGHGNCVFRIRLSKFLDLSLISVDVHPSYISLVIKGKVFRLLWPEEVCAASAAAQRSETTGELVITVPKVKQNKVLQELRRREKAEVGAGGGAGAGAGGAATKSGSSSSATSSSAAPTSSSRTRTVAQGARPAKLGDEMLEASKAVSLSGIAKSSGSGSSGTGSGSGSSSRGGGGGGGGLMAEAQAAAAAAAAAAKEAATAKDYVGDGMGGTSLFREVDTRRSGAASGAGSSGSGSSNGSGSAAAAAQPSGSSTTAADVDDADVPPLE